MFSLYSTLRDVLSGYLLPLVVLVFLLLSSYAPRWYYLLKYKLPPGPISLPFLGYYPLLNKETGCVVGGQLAKKYGNIVSLYIGSKYVVVLDDFYPIKIAYNKEEFLNRPDNIMEAAEGQPSVVGSNGPFWKEQRRFLATCLRQLGTGNKNFEAIVKSFVTDVCSSLTISVQKEINLDHEFELAINNITFYLIYGKKFETSHPMIRLLSEYNDSQQIHLVQRMMTLFFPMLAYLMEYTPILKNARKTQAVMDEIIRKEILEHHENLNANEPRDIIDHFLLNMNKPGSEDSFKMETLLGSVKMLLFVSSESTKSTLIWFFLLMAKYKDVQIRIQKEIDSHLGREQEPRFSDRAQLCYTEASILESMRLTNLVNWNGMRSTSSNTTLCGFDIPKGTVIMCNLSSQFHNPDYFERPYEFDPTRFLTKDEKKVQVPEHFIPFSYGKRNCAGDKLATMIIFLFSTSILQRFDVLPPNGGENLKKKVIFSNMATYPYVSFKNRI